MGFSRVDVDLAQYALLIGQHDTSGAGGCVDTQNFHAPLPRIVAQTLVCIFAVVQTEVCAT